MPPGPAQHRTHFPLIAAPPRPCRPLSTHKHTRFFPPRPVHKHAYKRRPTPPTPPFPPAPPPLSPEHSPPSPPTVYLNTQCACDEDVAQHERDADADTQASAETNVRR